MKIKKLLLENYKIIKFAQIEPTENIIFIVGKNAQGKSTIMKGFWEAIVGKSKETLQPIREGEDKAKIEVELDDFKIVREFTKQGTKVSVFNKDGYQISSPQDFLNKLSDKKNIHIRNFTQLNDKDQRQLLLSILDINIDQFDNKRKEIYDRRHLIGLEKKTLGEYDKDEIEIATEYKDKTVISISDLSKKFNDEKQKRNNYTNAQNEILSLSQQIIELQKLMEAKKQILDTTENLEELEKQLNNQESENEKINYYKNVYQAIRQIELKDNEYNSLSTQITDIDTQKKNELHKCNLENLEIGDEYIKYKGQPLSQASSSEQILVNLNLFIKSNPKLRVFLIQNGNILDDDTIKKIDVIAKENDINVWIEYVSEDKEKGFYLEDGEIIK